MTWGAKPPKTGPEYWAWDRRCELLTISSMIASGAAGLDRLIVSQRDEVLQPDPADLTKQDAEVTSRIASISTEIAKKLIAEADAAFPRPPGLRHGPRQKASPSGLPAKFGRAEPTPFDGGGPC